MIGLLEYRATPLEIGQSPAEILFGRQIHSVLPVVKERLIIFEMALCQINRKLNNSMTERQNPIKRNNKLWKLAVIIKQHDYRSYTAKTKDDNVLYRRNRRHFLKIK